MKKLLVPISAILLCLLSFGAFAQEVSEQPLSPKQKRRRMLMAASFLTDYYKASDTGGVVSSLTGGFTFQELGITGLDKSSNWVLVSDLKGGVGMTLYTRTKAHGADSVIPSLSGSGPAVYFSPALALIRKVKKQFMFKDCALGFGISTQYDEHLAFAFTSSGVFRRSLNLSALLGGEVGPSFICQRSDSAIVVMPIVGLETGAGMNSLTTSVGQRTVVMIDGTDIAISLKYLHHFGIDGIKTIFGGPVSHGYDVDEFSLLFQKQSRIRGHKVVFTGDVDYVKSYGAGKAVGMGFEGGVGFPF